jgi:hypothetical protein
MNIDLDNILTDEECEFIERIQKKIFDHAASTNTNTEKTDDRLDFYERPDLIHPDRLTDAPVEITFTVRVMVTETDENGNPKETIEVLDKFYHIPIINGKNYKVYVDNFLNRFDSKLEQTCQELQNNE